MSETYFILADYAAINMLQKILYKPLGLNGETIVTHAMAYLIDREAYAARRNHASR